MNTLFVFTGPQDPFVRGLIGEEQLPGPILSAVLLRSFERLIVFHTDETISQAVATAHEVRRRSSTHNVQLERVACSDLSDYQSLYGHLRGACSRLVAGAHLGDIFIAVSPEPAAVHACWVLLVSTGELEAQLLEVRPPSCPTDTTSRVSETSLPSLPSYLRHATRETAAVQERMTLAQAADEEETLLYSVREPTLHDREDLARRPRPRARREEPADRLAKALAELGMIAEAPAMRVAVEQIEALAGHHAHVLILGETGTGKELAARLIRRMSPRAAKPLVVVNCGGLSTTLVESTLFGHSRGAFTGAVADQTGKFEDADGGTLFLDEIGNMPMEVQAKLLRVLEDGIVEPLGGRRPIHVDVRVVAATNADIDKAIRKGQLREDLYYRIAGGVVRLPPLRQRREDIPRIAVRVLDKLNQSTSRPRSFSTEALARLQTHDWPGNIRELQNTIGQSMMLSRHATLEADDLLISRPADRADPLTHLPEPYEGFRMEDFLRSARKQLIFRAIELSAGNQSGAARLLGVTPQAVHKFLRET